MGANLAFLHEFEEQNNGIDDRYRVGRNRNYEELVDLHEHSFHRPFIHILAALDGGSVAEAIDALDEYCEGLPKTTLLDPTMILF